MPPCRGCGGLEVLRLASKVLGERVVFVNAAGCFTLVALYDHGKRVSGVPWGRDALRRPHCHHCRRCRFSRSRATQQKSIYSSCVRCADRSLAASRRRPSIRTSASTAALAVAGCGSTRVIGGLGTRSAHKLAGRPDLPHEQPRVGQPLATTKGAGGGQWGHTQERSRSS
jgi:hypothetical protein